ncbi:MAG: hypothetical protein IID49_10055 [Proteobacteria bacterium]|nr:hypothetical protein [Pseudomonadota bacterium]
MGSRSIQAPVNTFEIRGLNGEIECWQGEGLELGHGAPNLRLRAYATREDQKLRSSAKALPLFKDANRHIRIEMCIVDCEKHTTIGEGSDRLAGAFQQYRIALRRSEVEVIGRRKPELRSVG